MGSSSKRRQTMAKMTRERALQEKRERKQQKKDEKKEMAAAERAGENGDVDAVQSDGGEDESVSPPPE
jgi:hypothetical protein